MGVYDLAFRHAISRADAEAAHRLSFGALRKLYAVPAARRRAAVWSTPDPSLAVTVFGRQVPSPLGLAAGFDKNAEGIDALAALGFGFIEIGTVTGAPQPGNPTPRLFRLTEDRAIINRMGFNNEGSEAVARRLAARAADPHRSPVMVGVNIGKTKVVPTDEAVDDYVLSARRLAAYADYLVVNVSSPNTPGLRDLQAVEDLRPLLEAVAEAADDAAGRPVPLLVKIAPDLADDDVIAAAGLVGELGLAGIVATNTTISRDGLRTPAAEVAALGAGGLSGPVLAARSTAVLTLCRSHVPTDAVVISVGGISSADDARRRLDLGATLVQAYTGLIYGGPLWVSRVNRALASGR